MATKEFSQAFVPTTFSTDEGGLLSVCPNCYPKPLSSVTGHTVGSWGPRWEGVIVTGQRETNQRFVKSCTSGQGARLDPGYTESSLGCDRNLFLDLDRPVYHISSQASSDQILDVTWLSVMRKSAQMQLSVFSQHGHFIEECEADPGVVLIALLFPLSTLPFLRSGDWQSPGFLCVACSSPR